MNNTETNSLIYLIIAAPIALILFFAFYVRIVRPFFEDRHYIVSEMRGACDYDEYKYWRHELTKLYIDHIPFVGHIIVDFMK